MKTKTPDELHADKNNWILGVFYSAKDDPRICVKSGKFGWTPNLAKPGSWLLMLCFFLSIWGFGELMKSYSLEKKSQLLALVPFISCWLLLFAYLSRAKRSIKG